MIETLEHLIQQAANFPRHSRAGLYKELLHSQTFLLNLGSPLPDGKETRRSWADEAFDIWADKDPELGGIWVPVFAARDAVADYVEAKGLQAPRGKEFLWMEHSPGRVFSLLRGVDCFAGLTLHLDAERSLSLPWSDVKALSEGRIPEDQPQIYDLPLRDWNVPSDLPMVFGRVEAGRADAKLLCLPQAGHFKADDLRKLVHLDMGDHGKAWMACRHFLQVLRYLKEGRDARYCEDVLNSLSAFEMYGEAEAFCDTLAETGQEALAWAHLAPVYLKTGKLAECAELCRRGARKYPAQKSFFVHEIRALFALGRDKDATKALKAALERFPTDAALFSELAWRPRLTPVQ